MKYFTGEETERLLMESRTGLICCDESNPNREAILAAERAANVMSGGIPNPYVAVGEGFLLGYATGIRAERARRGSSGKSRAFEKTPCIVAQCTECEGGTMMSRQEFAELDSLIPDKRRIVTRLLSELSTEQIQALTGVANGLLEQQEREEVAG